MAEYIERDAAIEAALSCTDSLEPIEVDTTVESIVWKLRKLPIADVQPVKHGKWIAKDNLSYSCSVCRVPQWNISMFCPYCGAKMNGEA